VTGRQALWFFSPTGWFILAWGNALGELKKRFAG